MGNKTFWLGFVVVYVLWQAMGYLVHEVLLADTYAALAHIWRPEADMMSMMWIMFVTSAVYLLLFCYIFTKGWEGRGVMEGARYGLLMGLFLMVPAAFDAFVVYPITLNLALIWLATGLIQFVIVGVAFAAIYKPAR
ncbi:MAG TPA: hypothetical protein VFG21_05110 [Xanthomonadaceae bacterium]|nr:hypothetical protein [Xanthomonadaceae bacterium]